jgi:hypothetical protein
MSTKKKKPLSLTVKRPAIVKPAAPVDNSPPSAPVDNSPPAAVIDDKGVPTMTEITESMLEGGEKRQDPTVEEIIDDPNYATKEILEYAFKTWAGTFMNPMFYFMTRTFAHHRNGEKYDTGLVFNQLMQIQGGDHDKLLEDIRVYGETLQRELESFLAARKPKR